MSFFEVDLSDFHQYETWLKRSPKKIKAATAIVLNNLAFGTRTESINLISERMFIKQPGFVPKRILVQKASLSAPIRFQVSKVGSVALPRFSGWEEQETGARTKRSRVFSLLARGGSKARVARSGARLKPGVNRPVPEDYSGKNSTHRVIVMLQTLGRQGYKRPFIVRGHKRMAPGLYRFRGGKRKRKIQILQAFDPRQVQPKRIRWLRGGQERFTRKNPPGKLWANAMKRLMKPKR